MGSIITNKWTIERIQAHKELNRMLIKDGYQDVHVYDSVLEEMLRLRNIISSPVISQWANEICGIVDDADKKAYKDQKHPFMDQDNPIERRFAKACEGLFDGLQEYVGQGFAQWNSESIEKYRQEVRRRNIPFYIKPILTTNMFSSISELERLQKIMQQSDIKPYTEDVLRMIKQTTMMRFDESFDHDGTMRYLSPDTVSKAEYKKGDAEIGDPLINHLQLYIDQAIWIKLGDTKLKWQVVSRHKDWVKGITITESRTNAFAYGPEERSLQMVRFFTKQSGGWKFMVYEGPYYPGAAQEVIRRVGDIMVRETAGDKSVLTEYGKSFLDISAQT